MVNLLRCTIAACIVWLALVLALAYPGIRTTAGAQSGEAARPEGRRLALLVVCTKYPNLPEKYQALKGPASDGKLLSEVLQKHFGFAIGDIEILAEDTGKQARPVRANIQRAFERLARIAAKGDQIVILLSGHGSQQPDQEPYDELDGLDETFLPADAGPWDAKRDVLTNAIVDDEINAWTKAIADKGAHVWLIVDACHSGTMLRGGDHPAFREVPLRKLASLATLERAQEQARRRFKDRVLPVAASLPGVVAFYACQPDDLIPDLVSPEVPNGPLTFHLCQVVTQAPAPLTYRELARRIQDAYLHGTNESVRKLLPFAEGGALDQEVLGQRVWPGRRQFAVSQRNPFWRIDGGLLHGLSAGSILAVYPPAEQGAKPTGYVRIVRCDVLESFTEAVDFAGLKAVDSALANSRAELVQLDYGSLRLKVAIDDDAKAPDKERRRLADEIDQATRQTDRLLDGVKPTDADWLIQARAGKWYLLPAGQARAANDPSAQPPRFGPYSSDDGGRLKEDLDRVARATNLLKLTRPVDLARRSIDVDIAMMKLAGKDDPRGRPLIWEEKKGLTLADKDWVRWQVHNKGKEKVDVTLLFIDSGYGITPVFPAEGLAVDHRLDAGAKILLPAVQINAHTVGQEHLVLIAVKAEERSFDFTCLAQPTLRLAEEAAPRGKGKALLASPLGQLLRQSAYGVPAARNGGLTLDSYALRLLSWRVLPAPPKR